ncbi:hypothetical protein CBR_g3250 [Chara braunii]|uniref:Uncharacterized protein n=1 Tax=Chara braunii TaxID=69332 RepID=A0A388KF78_CHABU|nr:hypothetical protein CBR_g3250 [Chara braunii]|eukprot:GBG68708.1 hypothetical protein CBR_g3250 [Chara braunii]
MNESWNAKFESVCSALCSDKAAGVNNSELEKLKKQVELLQVSKRTTMGNPEASTSRQTYNSDAALAHLLQEQKEMRAKLESAVGACRRVETLENELWLIKQSHDDAIQEMETWKKEALRTDNKRSHIATSPASTLKMPPAATPRRSPSKEQMEQTAQLRQLHNLEAETLKELRLQELNRRREAEQENARLKEELAKRSRATPKSSFWEKLDEVDVVAGGSVPVPRTSKGKKKPCSGSEIGRDNDREALVRESKKEFHNLKKDDVMEICTKEGIKYTTLSETITEIINKCVERAFGKKPVIQEVSDDVAGESQDDSRNDGRDSAAS